MKHAKRILSLFLSMTLVATLIPVPALADSRQSAILYTEADIQQMLAQAEVPEWVENGVFSFPGSAFILERSQTAVEIPILRAGPCQDTAEVRLRVIDVNASYGKDYVLEVDGQSIDLADDARQLIATEDMNDPQRIYLNGEETQEIDAEAEALADTAQSDAADNPSSLHALKEAVFDRELSQTDSYYGDGAGARVAASDTTAKFRSAEAVLFFAPGEQHKALTIRLLSGGTSAGDESFRLELEPLTDACGVGDYTACSVTLKHEGQIEQPILTFADSQLDVSGDAAEVTILRQGGLYTAAAVSFTTCADTLAPGDGYTAVSQTVLFMPGESEKVVQVPVTGKAGDFRCLLESPEGALLEQSELTVTVQPQEAAAALLASKNKLEESIDISHFQKGPERNSSQELRESQGYYNIENNWRDHYHDNGNYGIAKYVSSIPAAAYSSVTLSFDSHGEFDHAWDAWAYTWDSREASTVTTALWKRESDISYIPPDNASSAQTSTGLHSSWRHPGDLPRWSPGHTQTITIPDNSTDIFNAFTVQQSHIKPWLSRGSVHITGLTLQRRQISFKYLEHDAFLRRDGSVSNVEKITDIFTLQSSTGNNDSKYCIGDRVAYTARASGGNSLYTYMTRLGRQNVSDKISKSNTSGFVSTGSNSGFDLNTQFFKEHSDDLAASGINKIAYIKPTYNKETWKADVRLNPSADGTAQLGFTDATGENIYSLDTTPAYLSETVILRLQPKEGLYAKGYRVEYTNYNAVPNCAFTVELPPQQMEKGKVKDFEVPVEYLDMEITPIFTSMPARQITITVDEATRSGGQSFPEGVIEAAIDQDGNRIGELEVGQQVTLSATAKSGYVPVWTWNGRRYSGETFDFAVGLNDTNIAVGLSFEVADAVTHAITGTLREPKVNINLRNTDGDSVPLTDAQVASGTTAAWTDEAGAFRLGSLVSIVGTKRTLRVVRGGESYIYEVDVPDSGDASLGTVQIPLPSVLPYLVAGTVRHVRTDSQGNMNIEEAAFGGAGQSSSTLYRYDVDGDAATGTVSWFGSKDPISRCQILFTNREGIEVSRVEAVSIGTSAFQFTFNPIQDTRSGGGVFVLLTDEDGNQYGPYDTGIIPFDPPEGDIDLLEGPSVTIPTQEVSLPVIKMSKPNFSSGLFQANFSESGMQIIVGFNVLDLYKTVSSNIAGLSNAKSADTVSKEAEKQKKESTSPKASGTTGSATAKFKSIDFACTLTFGYFTPEGEYLKEYKEGAVLAIYDAMFYIGGSGEASATVNGTIYGIPVYLEIKGQASVAVIVDLYATGEDGKRSHFPLTTFNEDPTSLAVQGLVPISITLGLEAGVGMKKVIAVAVNGSVTMDFKWIPWDTGTGDMTFQLGGGLYIFGQALMVKYDFPTIPLFDTTNSTSLFALDGPVELMPVNTDGQRILSGSVNLDSNGLNDPGVTVVDGVLHDASSQVVSIGNDQYMLVFLADDGSMKGVNHSALYYAILDMETGIVSAPALVDQDGTPDSAPDVVDLGDKVLLAWSDAQRPMETEDGIRDAYAAMDIVCALYDKTTGVMGAVFPITQDSQGEEGDLYQPGDTQPAIYVDEKNGQVGVYYLKEDFGQILPDQVETVQHIMNGEATAAFCPIDLDGRKVLVAYGEAEQPDAQLMDALDGQHLVDLGLPSLGTNLADPKIERYAVTCREGYSLLAYPVDLDQSGYTDGDQAVFLIVTDLKTGKRTSPICLTETTATVGQLRFLRQEVTADGKTQETVSLVWESDGRLLCMDIENILYDLSEEEQGLVCGSSAELDPAVFAELPQEDSDFPRQTLTAAASDGGIYLISTGLVDGNSEVFIQYYRPELSWETSEPSEGETQTVTEYLQADGAWSNAVQVTQAAGTDAGQQILLKDAETAQDGSLLLLYDVFQGSDQTGQLRLLCLQPTEAIVPELELELLADYPQMGDVVPIQATVSSEGLLPSEVTVTFTLDTGLAQTELGTWTGTVPAGGAAVAGVDWTLTEPVQAGWKITAATTAAQGEIAVPCETAVTVDDNPQCSYVYGSDSSVTATVCLENVGNVVPECLSVEIYHVDNDIFYQSMAQDGLTVESAYTLLTADQIAAPFAEGDHLISTWQVELPATRSTGPQQLLFRVLDADGQELDSDTLLVSSGMTASEYQESDRPEPEPTPTPSGGGYSSRKPSVSVGGDGEGGKVTADRDGTVTITPDEGYEIVKITVNGEEVEIPEDGKLTGLKRTDKVVVTFGKITIPVSQRFTDVVAGAWYEDAVQYVVDNGLFNGTSDTTFAPDVVMNRGMLTTVLYRLAQEPETTAEELFRDVASGQYYTQAVSWAAEKGIVTGYGDGLFGPDDAITREQLAVMLWRYAGQPAGTGSLGGFTDSDKADAWALDALRWAVAQGIITGKDGGILDPQGQATRAEVAAMLMRYCTKTQK